MQNWRVRKNNVWIPQSDYDRHDHTVDALRYAIEGMKRPKHKTNWLVIVFLLAIVTSLLLIVLNLEPVVTPVSYTIQNSVTEQSEASKSPIITETVALITKYQWTGNKMVNGEYPYIGVVAVSDRSISLGTKIIIDNQEYVIKDRTALWVYEKFDLVIDIYSEDSLEEILKFGRQNKIVRILTL